MNELNAFNPIESQEQKASNNNGDSNRKRYLNNSNEEPNAKVQRTQEDYSDHPNQQYMNHNWNNLKKASQTSANEIVREIGVFQSCQLPQIHALAHTPRLMYEEQKKLVENINSDWLDVESPFSRVSIVKRIVLPRPHQGYNIAGRLLGVKGGTLKQICKTYKCHMGLYGSNSSRNSHQEEQRLLQTGDPMYQHFAYPLHIEISINAEPVQAYNRFSKVLELISKFIKANEAFEYDGVVYEISPPNDQKKEVEQAFTQSNTQSESITQGGEQLASGNVKREDMSST